MILSDKIIEEIKSESGLMFDKAGDFAILSSSIYAKTKRNIGVTTLKRLFCYINDERKASDYTLNTIALYLGYPSWTEYASARNLESEWGFDDESIYIQALDPGTHVTIQYLDRTVTTEVFDNNGFNMLRVTSVENGSLLVGDILNVYKIKKGEILEAKEVIRGHNHGNYKTNGEIKVITIK